MKRRYIYILILTMVVCLNACGKPEKAADTSSDNKKETVSQTASLGETEMPGATKSSVTEDDTENDTENDLPMIEFEKTAEKPEVGTAAPNWSQDVTAKPTEPSKKPTEPTENPTENPTEPTPEPAEKPIELPFAPIN